MGRDVAGGESVEALEARCRSSTHSGAATAPYTSGVNTTPSGTPRPTPGAPHRALVSSYGHRSGALGRLADGWLPSGSYAPRNACRRCGSASPTQLAAGRHPQDIRRIDNVMGFITGRPVQGFLTGPWITGSTNSRAWSPKSAWTPSSTGLPTTACPQIERFASEVVPAVQEQVTRTRGFS